MRVTSPAVTIKDIWDALAASYVAAGSFGKLLNDYLDAPVSGAKADLTSLESRLSAARAAYLDNFKAPLLVVASDDLIASDDAEETGNETSYIKVKEFMVLRPGQYRVKFDLASNGATPSFGTIYKNGVAYGTEQTQSGTTYSTKSEDLDFDVGDLVQLYVRNNTGGANEYKTRNYRIYGVSGTTYVIVRTV